MDIKKYVRVIVTLILTLITMTLIFLFSNQTADESTVLSTNVTEAIFWWGDIDIYMVAEHFVRKAAHLTEYFVLGSFLMLHLTSIGEIDLRFDKKKIFVFTMVIGIAYAISDEIHQIFVPMRGPVITDVLIDAVGVLLGALFVRALIEKHRRKRSDNGSKKG